MNKIQEELKLRRFGTMKMRRNKPVDWAALGVKLQEEMVSSMHLHNIAIQRHLQKVEVQNDRLILGVHRLKGAP